MLQAWGDVLDVRLIKSFGGYSFEDQARAMHTADVIISPHGEISAHTLANVSAHISAHISANTSANISA